MPPQQPVLDETHRAFVVETLTRYPGLRATRLFDMLKARGYEGSVRTLRERVEWLPEYRNRENVPDAFNRVDTIIHEAQQARVPVIVTGLGGMSECVADGVNGPMFAHRDPASLASAS